MPALKNKKALLILSISILLVCILVGLIIWFFGFPPKIEPKEPIDTDELLPPPDSIYAYQDGRSVELTGAELDNVYQQFMASIGRHGWGELSAGPPGYSISCVANSSVCFEFRYKKRQTYMPDEIPDSPIFTPFEVLYKEREYDSLLFVIENDQQSEDHLTVRIACYGPENMISPNMARQPSSIKKSFADHLSTFLK